MKSRSKKNVLVCGTVIVAALTMLATEPPVRIAHEGGWVPVSFSGCVQPGSALDFSALRPTGAQAGTHGRVVARSGHFEFAKRPRTPQRFWGVNFNYSATIPPEGEAEQIAERLARLGYNSVRIHHHDGGIVRKPFDGVELDEGKMRRMDALVAACARYGIYVSTDLFVSRTNRGIPYRSVGIDADGTIQQQEYKELLPFHEGVASNYFEFARAFLNHTNCVTGVRYADDPTIAFLSLVNEDEFGNWGSRFFDRHDFLQQAWKDWVEDHRKSNPEVYGAVKADENLSKLLHGPPDSPTSKAFMQFVAEASFRFASRAKAVIRDELKCEALITDLNGWKNWLAYQPLRAECLDFVDTHFYVDHPVPQPKGAKYPRKMRDGGANPVRNGRLAATGFAPMRIFGKPFILSEFNYCAPARFRALGNLALGSMAALQDWSGLWRFTYGHDADQVAAPAHHALIGSFNGANDPMSIAADKAMFALFVRGGLKPLGGSVAMTVETPSSSPLPFSAYKNLPWDWLSWHFRTGTRVGGRLPEGVRSLGDSASAFACSTEGIRERFFPEWKETGRIPDVGGDSVSINPEKGSLMISTSSCAGGFAEQGNIQTADVRAEISGGPAGVWAVSLDGKELCKSGRMLVCHVTDAQNDGAVFADGTMSVQLKRGHSPMMMRAGKASVSIAYEGNGAKVFALADDGRRLRETPSRLKAGRLEFLAEISVESGYATVFYEVEAGNSDLGKHAMSTTKGDDQ